MAGLRTGRLLSFDDLREEAKTAVVADGRSYKAIGEVLGRKTSAVSGAVNETGPHVFKMQVRLLELLTPYTLDEPTFRVIRKPARIAYLRRPPTEQ